MRRQNASEIFTAKDDAYYLRLDLSRLAAAIKRFPGPRPRCPEMGEAIHALLARADCELIADRDLLTVLGEPEQRILRSKCDEIWTYKWFGISGSIQYLCATPLLIRAGHLIGVHCSVPNRQITAARGKWKRRTPRAVCPA